MTDEAAITRIMLVDDHEVVRAGLRSLLDAHDDIDVVAEAATGADAVLRARSDHPDVVVLDVRLPDRSGVEVWVLDRLRHPVTGGDARLARLTPTELRIVEMIAEGATNRAIGERIGLAEKTIKNYVSSILAKMHMSRRSEAAAYLAEHRARQRQEHP